MSGDRKEKNSERIEIRLPYTAKNRFLEACRRAGDTPSQVLRSAITAYSDTIEAAERQQLKQDLKMKLINNPLKAASMLAASAATALFLVTAPSAADDSLFDTFDHNNDGELTKIDLPKEISTILNALDRDKSGSITKSEFTPFTQFPLISLPGSLDELAPINDDKTIKLGGDTLESSNITLVSIDMSEAGRVVISREKLTMDELEALNLNKIIIEDATVQ